MLKPSVVVETGVGAGLSSTFILQALNDNHKGNLYSIDLPKATYTTRKARKSMIPLGFRRNRRSQDG